MRFEDYIDHVLKGEGIAHARLGLKESRAILRGWRAGFESAEHTLRVQRGNNTPLWKVIKCEARDYDAELRYSSQKSERYFVICSDWHTAGFSCSGGLLPSLDMLRKGVDLVPQRAGVAICDAEFRWTYVLGINGQLFFSERRGDGAASRTLQ